MKRKWIIAGVAVAVVGIGGWFAWETYKIYLPGLISRLRDPIAANHEVVWQKGPEAPAAGERPPNIIVIVADDLGYNDISFWGGGVANGAVKTPNIDSIGRQGASFDTAYAANATCSPSRAAIMTGRYPTRFGFEFTAVPSAFAANIAHFDSGSPVRPIFYSDRVEGLPAYENMGVPASEITIAELLKTRGYHTLHIGKWHLGESPALRPEAQGFDESLGFMAGAALFLEENDPNVVNAKLPFDPIDRFIWANLPYAVQYNGQQRFAPNEYLTDYFANQAAAAIRANKNRPFFMYVAFNAPHTPLQALKSDYDALSNIEDHTARVYGAMIRSLDRGVGRILQELRAQGLDENTLVIFTSDNGGAWYVGMDDLNAPFRGWKATFFEGGIRVPMFVRWPGRIASGTRLPAPADHLDIFATAAAAAGATLPTDRQMDSVNLIAAATGGPDAAQRRALYWRSGHYRVVRAGDWKLQVSERPQRVWLFNLAEDPTEQHDLSAREPERVRQMRAMISAHEARMPAPMWPALLEGPVRIDVPLNAPWADDQEYVMWAN